MSRALRKPTKILRERDVEQYAVKRVLHAGGEVRKVKWIGRRNAPDRVFMFEGMAIWPEFKRPGKKATDAQAREHARMRRAGMFVVVLGTRAEVDEMMNLAVGGNGLIAVNARPDQMMEALFDTDRRLAGMAYENLLEEARENTRQVEKRIGRKLTDV